MIYIDFLLGAAMGAVILCLLYGAYLMVEDRENEYQDRKRAEKNFKKFLKENDYKVLGRLTGVKRR